MFDVKVQSARASLLVTLCFWMKFCANACVHTCAFRCSNGTPNADRIRTERIVPLAWNHGSATEDRPVVDRAKRQLRIHRTQHSQDVHLALQKVLSTASF